MYDSNMLKKQLRQEILSLLKSQDPIQKAQADHRLLEQLCQSEFYKNAQTIATFLSFPFEYDTSLLINQMQKDKKKILIPKTYPKGKMDFVVYEPDQLVETHFGLREIPNGKPVDKSAIDLIHVPGLVFNEDGFRIGFGGGYYDRYLADYQGMTVSLIYPFQICNFEEKEYDMAVREVIRDETDF